MAARRAFQNEMISLKMKSLDRHGSSLLGQSAAGSEFAQCLDVDPKSATSSSPPRAHRLRSLFKGPVRRISAGVRIFWPGEPARNLFFVATGMVKLTDVSAAGDEVIVHLYQPGDIFGERCFLPAAQHYCATALEYSEVLEMSARGLIEQVRNRPDTLLELLGELSGRLAATDGEFQAYISDSVVVRLGAKLLALTSTSETNGDWLDVPHGFRHEEFAQMLGVQRETVTRALANLKKAGVVEMCRRGPLRIHGPHMRRFLRAHNSRRILDQRSIKSDPLMMQD